RAHGKHFWAHHLTDRRHFGFLVQLRGASIANLAPHSKHFWSMRRQRLTSKLSSAVGTCSLTRSLGSSGTGERKATPCREMSFVSVPNVDWPRLSTALPRMK